MLWLPDEPSLFPSNPLARGVDYDVPEMQGLGGLWSLDGSTGSMALDYSRNGNNGTLINSPTISVTNEGKCMSFNGSSQYISVPTSPSLRLGSKFTIASRFKIIGTGGGGSAAYYLVGKADFITDYHGYEFWITKNTGKLCSYIDGNSNGDYLSTGVRDLRDGNIHTAVMTADGSILTEYIDGTYETSRAQTMAPDYSIDYNFLIGACQSTNIPNIVGYFPGNIYYVYVNNQRALSPSEIARMHNNPNLFWKQEESFLYSPQFKPWFAQTQQPWMNGRG
jgi:hypothetical protein